MKSCEVLPSSDIPFETSTLYKIYLSFIEKGWNNTEKEPYKIESYRSDSGKYFSVIYGISSTQNIYAITIHCDPSASADEVMEFAGIVLSDDVATQLKRGFMNIVAFQCGHFDIFWNKYVDVTEGKFFPDNDYDLFLPCLRKKSVSDDLHVPDGYHIGKLSHEHISYLSEKWADDLGIGVNEKTIKSLENVFRLNILRPHVAIYHGDEELPVGWMMLYQDGMAGQLHVTKSHRKKGLGRFLIRKLREIVNESHGYGPPVNINRKNEISAALFADLGWVKQDRCPKHYLLRRAQK